MEDHFVIHGIISKTRPNLESCLLVFVTNYVSQNILNNLHIFLGLVITIEELHWFVMDSASKVVPIPQSLFILFSFDFNSFSSASLGIHCLHFVFTVFQLLFVHIFKSTFHCFNLMLYLHNLFRLILFLHKTLLIQGTLLEFFSFLPGSCCCYRDT